MSKVSRSLSSSGAGYNHSLDVIVNQGTGYGRLGELDGGAEPFLVARGPRKARFLRFGSRSRHQIGKSGQAGGESRTFLGRLRAAYERAMVKAASKGGDSSVIPVAKASRAPPALTSVVSTWSVSSSRVGTKIADLDPGFKLTSAEKKYLEHLKRSASCRRS